MKKTILLFLSALIANFLTAQVWTPVLPYVTRSTLHHVQFPTEAVGYAAGGIDNTFLKSTDGGNTWSDISFGTSLSERYVSMSFPEAEIGYVVNNYSEVFCTQNGGKTWEKRNSGLPSSNLFAESIWFRDRNTGYLGGNNVIYKTTDGGKNWNLVLRSSYPERMYFKAFGFQNGTTGYAVGSYYKNGTNHGVIMKTIDSGNTWTEQSYGNKDVDFSTVYFINDRVGYIGGGWYSIPSETYRYTLAMKTTDGGKNWEEYKFALEGGSFESLIFLDEMVGYACVGNIYKTTDGGKTWKGMENALPSLPLYSLSMIDYDKGIAVGSSGLISKLTPILPGVEDANTEDSLPYPNPSGNYIYIPITRGSKELILYDMQGMEVERYIAKETEMSVRVDVSRYPAGTYFYHCGNNNGKFIRE